MAAPEHFVLWCISAFIETRNGIGLISFLLMAFTLIKVFSPTVWRNKGMVCVRSYSKNN
ncbi:MAG: hypothetical protein HYW01_04530 [Deltaproteobacteria bacterium]|nr:hypothetical protein [Deltaproteobacteria bacterium]